MNRKEATSLLVSGLAITSGVLSAGLTLGATTAAPLIISEGLKAFGSLGGGFVGSAFLKHFIEKHPQDDVLKNGDLTRAIGSAIFRLCGEFTKYPNYQKDHKCLEKLAATELETWENLILGGEYVEGQGLVFSSIDLDDVSAEKAVQFFDAQAEKIDEIKTLTPQTWQNILTTLCEKRDCTLSAKTSEDLSKHLYKNFAKALREVLKDDFNANGKAFASMQFRLLREILYYTKENYQLTDSLLLIVIKILKKVEEINQNAPKHYSSENKEEWQKIFNSFDSFAETLTKIDQKVDVVIENQAEQNKRQDELQKTVNIVKETVENLASLTNLAESTALSEFLSVSFQKITRSFLDEQKQLNNFSEESFYLANFSAQWWGILNDLDEKSGLFHEVKQQIKENLYFDAPILAYFDGLGGTGKTTLARQIVVDFIKGGQEYDCWWFSCEYFSETENNLLEIHLKALKDLPKLTLVVIDEWNKLESSTKTIFKKLFRNLNKSGGTLKFVITDRHFDSAEFSNIFNSDLRRSFNNLPASSIDNNAILQKLFNVSDQKYQNTTNQLFNKEQILNDRPFFLLYVLIKASNEPELLNYLSGKNNDLSNETNKAKIYFDRIIKFDLEKLYNNSETKGLVLALGFIAYLNKYHNQKITKDAFLLLAKEDSETKSRFSLLESYQFADVKGWKIVGQYVYFEKNARLKRTDIIDRIAFNKDDFVDVILKANIFDGISVFDYISERKIEIARFLIEKADVETASIIAYTFCHLENTLKNDAGFIIQNLLDKKNNHPTYSQIFLNENEDLFNNNQKWLWIEQFMEFSKISFGFQINCTNWIKSIFKNDKQKQLQALKRLNDLGANFHNVINAILFATEGKEQVKKAIDLLKINKDSSVVCNCLKILEHKPGIEKIAAYLVKKSNSKEVICKCLDILKDNFNIKNIAKDLLEINDNKEVVCLCLDILEDEPEAKDYAKKLQHQNNLDHSLICKFLKILKNEPDIKHIAKTLLDTNKDREVINLCLDILQNDPDIESIIKKILETNNNPYVISKCAKITHNTELARQLISKKNQKGDIICVCLELLKNEPDINNIAEKLINPHTESQVYCKILELTQNVELAKKLLTKKNQKHDVICRCLPILKGTFEGKKYALRKLYKWKKENEDVIKRSIEILAGRSKAEKVIHEIITDYKYKKSYLYARIISYNLSKSEVWQTEVKNILKNWKRNYPSIVGYCLKHYEDDYNITAHACSGYLSDWENQIKREKKHKNPDFYFIIKSFAHPNLNKKSADTAKQMLKYNELNQGFLPDKIKQIAENIQKGEFPEWHTDSETAEINE